jgi:hypothetical protein
MSLDTLGKETGLSRNSILRARRGERVQPKTQRLRMATEAILAPKNSERAVTLNSARAFRSATLFVFEEEQ